HGADKHGGPVQNRILDDGIRLATSTQSGQPLATRPQNVDQLHNGAFFTTVDLVLFQVQPVVSIAVFDRGFAALKLSPRNKAQPYDQPSGGVESYRMHLKGNVMTSSPGQLLPLQRRN